MGAPGKVELFTFGAAKVSMAEAVAQAGGSNPNFGDPAAIFVFRYVTEKDGTARPVVYHMNMAKAGNYFLSQRFAMQDKDVLYVGNARANQPSKLIQIISQLFSPLVAVTSAATVL
jgi:polysaccharide export outer membrane protein